MLDLSYGPRWVNRIDLDKLSLALARRCVVGQLHGGRYRYGLRRLGVDHRIDHRYGFNVPDWPVLLAPLALVVVPLYYWLLTRAWKKEIRLLRMEHGRSVRRPAPLAVRRADYELAGGPAH